MMRMSLIIILNFACSVALSDRIPPPRPCWRQAVPFDPCRGLRCRQSLSRVLRIHGSRRLSRTHHPDPCEMWKREPAMFARLIAFSIKPVMAFGIAATILFPPVGARAQTAQIPAPAGSDTLTRGSRPSEPNFFTNLWTRDNLLGDIGGLRTTLGNYGITLNLQE